MFGAAAPHVSLSRAPVREEHRPLRECTQLHELLQQWVERPASGRHIEERGLWFAVTGPVRNAAGQPAIQRRHTCDRPAFVGLAQHRPGHHGDTLGQAGHQDGVVDIGDHQEGRLQGWLDHPSGAGCDFTVLDGCRHRVRVVPPDPQLGYRQGEVREPVVVGDLGGGVCANPQLDRHADDRECGVAAQIRLGDVPIRDPAVARQFGCLHHAHPHLGHTIGDESPVDDHMKAAKGSGLHLLLASTPGDGVLDPGHHGGGLRTAQPRGQLRSDPAGEACHGISMANGGSPRRTTR